MEPFRKRVQMIEKVQGDKGQGISDSHSLLESSDLRLPQCVCVCVYVSVCVCAHVVRERGKLRAPGAEGSARLSNNDVTAQRRAEEQEGFSQSPWTK